mmetsp:Transcript_5165/g.21261  ORF Transcript_5165/g.21261 Transcript_5165/m.21261 type:complete len:362 (-) Transcript_5165:79-1164(-)
MAHLPRKKKHRGFRGGALAALCLFNCGGGGPSREAAAFVATPMGSRRRTTRPVLSPDPLEELVLPISTRRLARRRSEQPFDDDDYGPPRRRYAVVSTWRAASDLAFEIDRKVRIRYLPEGADAAYLRDVLSDAFGPVQSVDIAPDDIAYVVFERPEDAVLASQTSLVVDGRRRRRTTGDQERTIVCEPFEPRRPTARRRSGRRVFVGNLPYEGVTNDLLVRVFVEGGCATPLSYRRPYAGVAYLDFPTEQDAYRAVCLAGTRVLGRAIRVDWDDDKPHDVKGDDDATTTAIIAALSGDSVFADKSRDATAMLLKRDAEDDEKLAEGVALGVRRGVLAADHERLALARRGRTARHRPAESAL